MPDILRAGSASWGANLANIAMIGLAISALPGACFSSHDRRQQLQDHDAQGQSLPSVGIGTLAAIVLAVTGVVGQVIWVFSSYRCLLRTGLRGDDGRLPDVRPKMVRAEGRIQSGGLDLLDRRLRRRRLQSRGSVRGRSSLAVGHSRVPHLADWADKVPVPPVSAFVVGFALYVALSVVGLRTRKLTMPGIAA